MALRCTSLIPLPSRSAAQLHASLSRLLSSVIQQGRQEMKVKYGADIPQICAESGVFEWDPVTDTNVLKSLSPPPGSKPAWEMTPQKNVKQMVNSCTVDVTPLPSVLPSSVPKRDALQLCSHHLYNVPKVMLPRKSLSFSSTSSSSLHRKFSLHNTDRPTKALRQIKLTDMMVLKKRRSQSFRTKAN